MGIARWGFVIFLSTWAHLVQVPFFIIFLGSCALGWAIAEDDFEAATRKDEENRKKRSNKSKPKGE